MRTLFVLIVAAASLASMAKAEENDIYAALNKVVASEDGAGIAQGLVEVGKNLTAMNVDETIAFRISLSLLIESGQVPNDTTEREMVNVLGQATGQHLLQLCAVDKSPGTVSKVNVELGFPYPCQVE